MSIGTLQDIITKVRKLTGSGTSLQLTDAQIIDYINSFYLYDFPAEFRSLKLKDTYTFNTRQNIDVYPFDYDHWSTVQQPCYCMNREIKLFTDQWSFYGVNYNWQQQVNFDTGDGTTGPYSGTLTSTPIIRSVNNNPMTSTQFASSADYLAAPSVPSFPLANMSRVQNLLITANTASGTLNVTDDGAQGSTGNLIGDCAAGGTINYQTGAIAGLTFTSAIPSGNDIQAQYNPATPSIPLSILLYQNQFVLRPVPDQGYTITLAAYRLPSQALLGSEDPDSPNLSGRPELLEWWETLAFGAAKKVYEDRLDPDGVALMDKGLAERYALNETRTYAQLGSQRIATLFSDQLSHNYGSGGWGFPSGS
ncbi:MAG: hypothetical protein A3F13_02670 [Gammaproteobacteria bacterium RIFCSPHIGHO2_12_FULL_40_19]|nr:MAG: hypothetical protein A3F13_02670 [Gammaproteobacteria bacterium RIFCSPHIGHO2_12_FULL_40_19]